MRLDRYIRYLYYKLFDGPQCDAKTQHSGVGVASKSAVYCVLIKHHPGPHRDYSGRRSWT